MTAVALLPPLAESILPIISGQIAYNSLLAAYTRNHMTKKVEALFEELKDAGLEPSKHTYSTVMNAYG